jgi:hypothetical protein
MRGLTLNIYFQALGLFKALCPLWLTSCDFVLKKNGQFFGLFFNTRLTKVNPQGAQGDIIDQ